MSNQICYTSNGGRKDQNAVDDGKRTPFATRAVEPLFKNVGTLITSSDSNSISFETMLERLLLIFSHDRVDVDEVIHLMQRYNSDTSDWKRFAKFDRYKYTRNLVHEGNGKFNLMLLCWPQGTASCIHDHSDACCFMKVLDGSLTETRYAWPASSEGGKKMWKQYSLNDDPNSRSHSDVDYDNETDWSNANIGQSMTKLDSGRLANLNDVIFINDSLGLHRVENASHSSSAVSLHLYSPPFQTCQIFDDVSGRRNRVKMTFWSKYGVLENAAVNLHKKQQNG